MIIEGDKCGEIYRYRTGQFIFSCAYCTETFDEKENALDHINSHFLIDVGETAATNNEFELKIFELSTTNYLLEHNYSEINKFIQFDVPLIFQPQEQQYQQHSSDSTALSNNAENLLIPFNDDFEQKTVLLEIEAQEPEVSNLLNQSINGNLAKQKIKRTPILNHKKKTKREKYFSQWGLVKSDDQVKCDICGFKMKRKQCIKHMVVHTNHKPFVCLICQKPFKRIESLRRHSYIHGTTKKYTCQYCGFTENSISNLKIHIRIHTGEKPFACPICGKTFNQKYTVKIHMRFHTGEKPYKCKFCEKSFSTNSIYNRHLRMHMNIKNYKCNLCDKKFSDNKHMKEHYRTHTGERPFTCKICQHTFARQTSYRQHLQIHSGKKPYKCTICGLGFTQSAGRYSHEKSVHKFVRKSNLIQIL